MRVILTHFYNEEFLLPWWLEHHKKYFDFGVLIDWGSTDRSVEIIRDICPHWQVHGSKFEKFDSHHLEWEMMGYERQIPSGFWRLSIPVAEFLVGDILGLSQPVEERQQWIIPTLVFSEFNPTGKLDPARKLWEQVRFGVHYRDLASHNAWQCRSFHNYNDIFYHAGRHFSNENTDRAMIFKFSNVLVGPEMIARKLQVQTKVSDFDRKTHAAVTHTSVDANELTLNNLHANQQYLIGQPYNCSNIIDSMTKWL